MWYKSKTNNFSICHCWVQIASMISIWFKKSASFRPILNFGDGKWAPRPVGWTMCFLLIASGLVRMPGASCVLCEHLLFLHSFSNLNLIFTYNSSATSGCVPGETTSVMMTLSNGNIFRVTGHLCGEFTGPRWIPRTEAGDAELWCFLWSASE